MSQCVNKQSSNRMIQVQASVQPAVVLVSMTQITCLFLGSQAECP